MEIVNYWFPYVSVVYMKDRGQPLIRYQLNFENCARYELNLSQTVNKKKTPYFPVNEIRTSFHVHSNLYFIICSFDPQSISVCSDKNHTMFFWASLRKSSLSIAYNQRLSLTRPCLNQSQSFTSSSFGGGFGYGDQNKSGDTLLKQLRSFSSRVVVAGSISLGFLYWFSASNVFADSPKEAWAEDDDQFRHSVPEKNGKFLFGGNTINQCIYIYLHYRESYNL